MALYVAPTLGGFVVGLGLVGHAVWDAWPTTSRVRIENRDALPDLKRAAGPAQ
jgi:hypothetical protein